MDGGREGHDTRTMAGTDGLRPGLQHEQRGDCPACAGGRIRWLRCCGPGDSPVLYAGACDVCGQWAAQCPVCGDRVRLENDVVECPCETCLVLLPEQSEPARIESVTADDVRRTYAVPAK